MFLLMDAGKDYEPVRQRFSGSSAARHLKKWKVWPEGIDP
jgi:hypothetical protein